MVLRPGLTTTDPQFQEGTTMTPQIMKGDIFLPLIQLGLYVAGTRDIPHVKAAQEGTEALCRPLGGTTEGIIFSSRFISSKYCKLGF